MELRVERTNERTNGQEKMEWAACQSLSMSPSRVYCFYQTTHGGILSGIEFQCLMTNGITDYWPNCELKANRQKRKYHRSIFFSLQRRKNVNKSFYSFEEFDHRPIMELELRARTKWQANNARPPKQEIETIRPPTRKTAKFFAFLFE